MHVTILPLPPVTPYIPEIIDLIMMGRTTTKSRMEGQQHVVLNNSLVKTPWKQLCH